MNKNHLQQEPRNQIVQNAYYAMLKVARQLLSTIPRDELRYSLIREIKPSNNCDIIHEFVNPLLYLRLESYSDNSYCIHYGFEATKEHTHITGAFCRSVYKFSMKEATPLNIEDSICTDWYIHNPDELYQYIEDRNKHHTFKLIKYRPSTNRRKQMKAVA